MFVLILHCHYYCIMMSFFYYYFYDAQNPHVSQDFLICTKTVFCIHCKNKGYHHMELCVSTIYIDHYQASLKLCLRLLVSSHMTLSILKI